MEEAPAAEPTWDREQESEWEAAWRSRGRSVWQIAATAALATLANNVTNATTVLFPSGAAEIELGMEIVRSYADTPGSTMLRALIMLPDTLFRRAELLYRQQFGDDFEIVAVGRGTDATRKIEKLMKTRAWRKNEGGAASTSRGVVILSRYGDLPRVSMAQSFARSRPIDLAIFEMAHIIRAGGHFQQGVDNRHLLAKKRVYISARRLTGRTPPGALLNPEQDPGPTYGSELAYSIYGPEAYRLTHADAVAMELIVPLRLSFLEVTSAGEVAQELARVSKLSGATLFEVSAGKIGDLVYSLGKLLKAITGGSCSISNVENQRAPSAFLDGTVIAGQRPHHLTVAQKFPRLARWRPNKECGIVFLAPFAKLHEIAAWRALALESQDVEEAIQQGCVETGRQGRALLWEEIPDSLRNLRYSDAEEKFAKRAINTGIKAVGDQWDVMLGRLLAFKERHGIYELQKKSRSFGAQVGKWVTEQQEQWKSGRLTERKIYDLKRLGVMLDRQEEEFAKGLSEVRVFVATHRTRIVPLDYCAEDGFKLGEWVVWARMRLRKGKLDQKKKEMLRDAFYLWEPSKSAFSAKHPDDPLAADFTMGIEHDLRTHRWRPLDERKGIFKALVFKHHPDLSSHRFANHAIKFLGEARSWFLARY